MPIRLLFALLALTLTLGLAACGEREKEAPESAATATATATPEAVDESANTNLDEKPVVARPTGEAPAELQTEDIVDGKGKAAKAGDAISVQYVGVSYSTGQEFDASWDRGEPFQFELGGGQVIPGWDQGLEGMKVGGRRKLVIPPDLGYGEAGSPPAIAPNETLIFIVDLLEIS